MRSRGGAARVDRRPRGRSPARRCGCSCTGGGGRRCSCRRTTGGGAGRPGAGRPQVAEPGAAAAMVAERDPALPTESYVTALDRRVATCGCRARTMTELLAGALDGRPTGARTGCSARGAGRGEMRAEPRRCDFWRACGRTSASGTIASTRSATRAGSSSGGGAGAAGDGRPEGVASSTLRRDERLPVRQYAQSLLSAGAAANREVGN